MLKDKKNIKSYLKSTVNLNFPFIFYKLNLKLAKKTYMGVVYI